MKKNKISKNWLNKQFKDPFVKRSKVQGYRSRSAFKLIEMNKKFKFLNKNTQLLDLGSSPGGWSQVAAKKIVNGKILAVDTKTMQKIDKVNFMIGDLLDPLIFDKIYSHFNSKIDLVISDMAPNTCGNKNLDSYRTGELCLKAMDLAIFLLLGIGIYVSLLIFYTFETLFFTGLIYIFLIPISYFHYKYKNKTSFIVSSEEDTEDVL